MRRAIMILIVGSIAALIAVAYGEATRWTCDKCGRAMSPLTNHPEVYECRKCETMIQTTHWGVRFR